MDADPAALAPGAESGRDITLAQAGPHITILQTSVESLLVQSVKAALTRAIAGEGQLNPEILQMEGMSGRNYRKFINNLVGSVPDPRYLEIGVHAGSTLCSAISKNKVVAFAIDNWSQFGGPSQKFFFHLSRFKEKEATVSFWDRDFRSVDYSNLGKFNIYLFDGPHSAADQRDGVVLAQPALDDCFIMIVDDWNWAVVREGTFRGIREAGLDIGYFAEIRTTLDGSHPNLAGPDSDWHNGYFIAVMRKG